MAKKPQYDPRRTFRFAEWYYMSAGFLRTKIPEARGAAIPACVLNALALELYFKCLLALETGKAPPRTHNLARLFGALQRGTQNWIRQCFDNPTDEYELNRRQALNNPPKHIPKEVIAPDTFEETLQRSAKAFERLRYGFEIGAGDQGAGWCGDYVATCTRRFIINAHPEWDKPEANH